MHNTVEGGRKNDDVCCVVIQRLREVFYVVSLHDALATVCLANALSSYLTAIVVESLQTLANGAVKLANVLHPKRCLDTGFLATR